MMEATSPDEYLCIFFLDRFPYDYCGRVSFDFVYNLFFLECKVSCIDGRLLFQNEKFSYNGGQILYNKCMYH